MSHGYSKGIPIDTDGSLSTNSDLLVPSQKAVKTYVNTLAAGIISIQSSIADDTSINAAVYPIWAAASGNQALKISTTKISFNPSTGALTVAGQIYSQQLNASGGMLVGYAAGTAGTVDGISKDGLVVVGHNSSQAGDLLFRTTPLSARDIIFAVEGTEAMRLTATGYLGIGKSPSTRLDVNGTVTATAFTGQVATTSSYYDVTSLGLLLSTTNVATNNTTHKGAPYVQMNSQIWTGAASTTKGMFFQAGGISGTDTAYQLNFASTDVSNILVLRGDNGYVGIGTTVPAGLVTVNQNTTTTPPAVPSAGTMLQLVAADANVTRALVDSFGAANAFTGRRADGTLASRTGVVLNDVLAQFNGIGYNSAAAYNNACADVRILATETHSGTAMGSKIDFRTTSNTTLTIASALTLDQDKSAIFGGNVYVPGQLATSSNTLGQYAAYICLRSSAKSQVEFGHSNTGGYGSTIGAENSSGNPYVAFQAGMGTNNNTYKTYGLKGIVLKTDTNGALTINSVPTASADNQSLTALVTLTNAGLFGIGTLAPSSKVDIYGTRTDINNQNTLGISDDTAMAADVGGGISLRGKYTSGGAYTEFAAIVARKDNATTGEYGAGLHFYTRTYTSGGWSVTADPKLSITSKSNLVLGSLSALATNATDGFTYIPTCAGAPSGAPTAYTGKVAMVYDTTNNNFYIYNGAWKKVALA